MGFTSNLSYVRKNPITTAVATVVLITGVAFTVNKTTPTAAIINEIMFEYKSSSGTSILGTGSGNLVMSGTILSDRPTNLGWAVKAGADAACNTTCTNACVFGVNTASLVADIVDCVDATADECLCAGPN